MYTGGGGWGMLDLDATGANGRQKIGAPRMRAISATALTGGFGVEMGLSDVQKPALHFHNPQRRAIKNAGETNVSNQRRRKCDMRTDLRIRSAK